MKVLKKILTVLGTVLLVILLAVVILMFNARISGEAPTVFGYQIYRVSSGSMEPELMIGDVILVKETDPQDIKKGDIVTYKGEEGDFSDKFITHKVVEEPEIVDGEYVFVTQGIYEGAVPDPQWSEEQLLGRYVRTIPYVDAIYNFFVTPYGLITFILIIIVLFGYELISLIVSYKTLDEIDDDESEEKSSKDNTENQKYEDKN